MAFLKQGLLVAALLVTGCVGSVQNQAYVYKPVTGVIQMQITVPAGETFTKVQFQANGQLVSEDTDGTDGYSAQLDTSTLPSGQLVKIAAIGVRTDGTTQVLQQNYIYVPDNGGASGTATASASDTTSTTASGASN